MPIYEYKCENGHLFDALQSMADDPLTVCEECGAPVQRVMHPVAVHFKGSGFYTTDYKNKGSEKIAKPPEKKEKSETKSDSTSDSKSESKSDSTSGSKSDSTTSKAS